MTEFEKELVRFVSGHLDAGVSAEDYVKAFSQRLLDSIGKQSKPKVCEGLEEEINRLSKNEYFDFTDWKAIARHFAQWGAEHFRDLTKKMETPVSDDLEEEAEEWAENEAYGKSNAEYVMAYRGYIAGAKWQKVQLMKKAIDAEFCSAGMFMPMIDFKDKRMEGIKYGDTIKVIVIKEK